MAQGTAPPGSGCWRVGLLVDGRKRVYPLIVATSKENAQERALHVAEGMAGVAELWGDTILEHSPGWHSSAEHAARKYSRGRPRVT